MRTIHLIYPPHLGMRVEHTAFEIVRYFNTLHAAANSLHIHNFRYASASPDMVGLVDTAEQMRLSLSTDPWPPKESEVLADLYAKRVVKAVSSRLSDDNYIIAADEALLNRLRVHVKNANYLLCNNSQKTDLISICPSYTAMATIEADREYRFFDSVITYNSTISTMTHTDVVVMISDGTKPHHHKLAEELMQKSGFGIRIFDLNNLQDCKSYEHAIGTAWCLLLLDTTQKFGVHIIDSLTAGTPVVAADGPLTAEFITHNEDGYRCRTFREFVDALTNVSNLSRADISKRAKAKYHEARTADQLSGFLDQVSTTWSAGFYVDKVSNRSRYY